MSSFEFPPDLDPSYFFDPSPETVQNCNNALDQLPPADLRYFNQNASKRIVCGSYTVIGSVNRMRRQFVGETQDDYFSVGISVYDQDSEPVLYLSAPETAERAAEALYDEAAQEQQVIQLDNLLRGSTGLDVDWVRTVLRYSASSDVLDMSLVEDLLRQDSEATSLQSQHGHNVFANGTQIRTVLMVPLETDRIMPLSSSSKYLNIQLTKADGKLYSYIRDDSNPATLNITHVIDQDVAYSIDENGEVDWDAYHERARLRDESNIEAAKAGVYSATEGKLREFTQALHEAIQSGAISSSI